MMIIIRRHFSVSALRLRDAKTVRVMALFDGTSKDDEDPAPSNVVKIGEGMIQDSNQMVFYRGGPGNDKEWKLFLEGNLSKFTGLGSFWIMKKQYANIKETLVEQIKREALKSGDAVSVSVCGFSRGAAISRHFASHYILKNLQKDIKDKTQTELNVTIDSEYLFDTVPSFGIPNNLYLLDRIFHIKTQEIDLGWDFSIPKGTKVYHALAVDEHRDAFNAKLVDHSESPGNVQEVWYDGDHSSCGGGYTKSSPEVYMGEEFPLRFIVQNAIRNGLQFKDTFLQQHKISAKQTDLPLGEIHTESWKLLPPTQKIDRKIRIVENGEENPSLAPILSESVIRRMAQDETYRPNSVLSLSQFRIYADLSVQSVDPSIINKFKSIKDLF